MGIDFFIVGLPRSRTAWIANYLTYGNMFCIFDGMKYGLDGSGPDGLERFEGVAGVVGNCDQGSLMFQDYLIDKYPKAKWIIIDRDWNEVADSIKKLGLKPDSRLTILHTKMGELRAKKSPFEVPYSSLNSSIKDIAKYVNPSWTHPKERHEMLLELNVQMDLELGKKQLSQIPDINPLSLRAELPSLTKKNQEYLSLLWDMCQPNEPAYRWMKQVINASLVWDHVRDLDAIDLVSTDEVFKALILEWAINPFWQTNHKYLLPVLSSSISDWQYSYLDGASKDSAYSIYSDVPSAIAFILGGQQKVDLFMPRIRKLVQELRLEDDARDNGRK